MLFYRLYRDADGRRVGFVQGNEACVEAALIAGIRFFAGYPITPSSEIASVCAEKLPMYGGRFIQMEDEIASIAAVIGASMTGMKAMTATSGPGFSLKQENLGYATLCEVPCLIVNVQRGGPSTGLPTQTAQADVMQTRWGTHGDHPVIAFSPSSVREVAELTIEAVNCAEYFRTPVVLLMDETVAHMRERIVLPRPEECGLVARKPPSLPPGEFRPFAAGEDDIPEFAPYGSGYRTHTTGLIHNEKGFPSTDPDEIAGLIDRIHRKIERGRDRIVKVKEFGTQDAETLLISFGGAARSCRGAMDLGRAAGRKIGVLQLVTVWPFPDREVRAAIERCPRAFVVEMNRGQVIGEVERAAGGRGVIRGINLYNGILITPEEILAEVTRP